MKKVLLIIITNFYICISQKQTQNYGYLFAHMTNEAYGKLYYSVSRDGLSFTTLNQGQIILPQYLGHPNIIKGEDYYYMIGVSLAGTKRKPILYTTKDLINWYSRELSRQIFDVSEFGYENEDVYLGAPKIFYDKGCKQFIITWHAFRKGAEGDELWESMRTFYVLTKDWYSFPKAKRLFNFTGDDENMATIDTMIVKENDNYYAIIKDERWPTTSPKTGKTIRISTSKSLTGPYSNPLMPATPSWREAPSMVKKLDGSGWFLYTEKYPQVYELYESDEIYRDKWTQIDIQAPHNGRHGCVIALDEGTYNKIVEHFK